MQKVILTGLVVAAVATVVGHAQNCDSYVPGKCGQVVVTNGLGCNPPVFIPSESVEPDWSIRMQFEIWQKLLDGRTRLFTRGWVTDNTFAYVPAWEGFVLLGNGPFGFRLFPAGTYWFRLRSWNPAGFGEWSDPTYFTVQCDPLTAPTITEAPSPSSRIHLAWETDFLASQCEIEILRNNRRVRRIIEPQRWDWATDPEPHNWSFTYIGSMPSQELPEGTGYVCRVRAYCPVLRQWSPWATTQPIDLVYNPPEVPVLRLTQIDDKPLFDMSPRPFFGIESSPASWYQFEIWRYQGSALRKVLQHWTRLPVVGGGEFLTEPQAYWWRFDLPAATYQWRVLAWNGPAPHQQVWSDWQQDTIFSAGALEPPEPGEIFWTACERRQEITWYASRNAYSYQVELERNGRTFLISPWLDTATGQLEFEKAFPNMTRFDDIVITPGTNLQSYTVEQRRTNSYVRTGTAKGWHGNDEWWSVNLPFEFPFWGVPRTNIYVNCNGIITFGAGLTLDHPSLDLFLSIPSIAVLWEDLTTEDPDDDIYVQVNTNTVTVCWVAHYNGNGPVEMSVTLHKSGEIEMKYGDGNEKGGFLGLSAGDGTHFVLPPTQVRWRNRVPRLPDGTYRFRVRARNMSNPPGQQFSSWSEWSDQTTINTVWPGISRLESFVNGYNVELMIGTQDDEKVCDRQFEVIHTLCPRFHFFTSDDELSLPPGNYRWRARVSNAWRGWGPWSGWESFEVSEPRP